jgi:flavin-dependent dehydrogenase
VVALCLARLGYRVCLVERHGPLRAVRHEALAPMAPLLEILGVLPAIERAGLLRPAELRLLWSGSAEVLQDQQAWLVDRNRFDRLLLDAAAEAGAEILCPACAHKPAPVAAGWIVPVEWATGCIEIGARFLINACGRSAARSLVGQPTTALCGRWRGKTHHGLPQMRIEAGVDAWSWGAPLPDGSYSVVAFLDAHRCAGLDKDTREALYRSVVLGSAFDDWTCGGLLGGVAICDATSRADFNPMTTSSIKVGDRAFAMDPLSSQGVQAALRSALQASIAVHTVLSGGDTNAAIEFCRQAQQSAVVEHRRVLMDLYRQQHPYDTQFWRERSQFAEPNAVRATAMAAFSLDTCLRLSPKAQIVALPVIDGMIIRRFPTLTHPALDRPVAWVGPVALGQILSSFTAGETVASVLRRWSSQISMEVARRTLAWLLQRRILVDAQLCASTVGIARRPDAAFKRLES